MSVLWFCASTCFQFWSKTFAKQIIIYYHVIKQFLPYLNWLKNALSMSECFGKILTGFNFNKKNYAKRCRRNHVISRVKDFLPLHFAVDQVLSISGYDLECKQKYCIKNMTVNIPVVATIWFNYISPCMVLVRPQMVLARSSLL